MLKCVFACRRNEFTCLLVDWLGLRTDLRAVIWTDSKRESFGWRWQWLRRSMHRFGVVSTLDRMLFRLWCIYPGELKQGWRRFIRDVCKTSLTPASNPAIQLTTSSMNSPEVEALLHRVQPDLLFVNCIAQRISQRIYQVPRLGTFIYHEGVTPEYRGVHSPFWALANGDDDKVGFTLLKCDDRLDGGEVYAQGAIRVDPLNLSLGYVGHWALYEGLDDVARFLSDLEHGVAIPLDVSTRRDCYYSYFPYSQLLKIRRRRKERGLPVMIADRPGSIGQ